MPQTIRRAGRLALDATGDLVARTDGGREVGRFYVAGDEDYAYLVYEGELTIFQDEDPSALRLLSRYAGGCGAMGKLSFNRLRADDRQDEIGYVTVGTASDASPGERRGEASVHVVRANDEEPSLAHVWSSAYTAEEFGGVVLASRQSHGVLALGKFAPPGGEPIPVPPVDDGTHGIPSGDFARILNVYGFPSDQQPEWETRRIASWPAIIQRMDERDGYRRFPPEPAPQPIPTPVPGPPTSDVEARRRRLDAINLEFVPWNLTIDSDAYDAFLRGRFGGKTEDAYLKEIHDDTARRNDGRHDPSAHPAGAPY